MITTVEYRFIRVLFGVCSLSILVALSPLFQISADKLEIILLFFVLTVGLSHGSLDWLLAKHWGLRRNIKQGILFGLGYLVVASVCFFAWLMFPAAGLIIFLIMSMLHFGNDWRYELDPIMAFCIGVAVVSIPAVRFHHDVARLFTLLAPRHESEYITMILSFSGWVSLLIVMPLTIKKAYTVSRWWLAAEILGLMLLGLIVTPLLYFILYFCNLHTLKHWTLMRDIGVYKHISKALWSASWPTAVCLIIGMVIIYNSCNINFSSAFIKTIFIGLGALTVPHWLLLEVFPKTFFFTLKK